MYYHFIIGLHIIIASDRRSVYHREERVGRGMYWRNGGVVFSCEAQIWRRVSLERHNKPLAAREATLFPDRSEIFGNIFIPIPVT